MIPFTIPFLNKLLIVLFIFICTYLWFKYKFSYWDRRGVVGPEPVFPYGNLRDVIKRKIQFFQPYCDSYVKYKHLPYVGLYAFNRPVLCVNDPEIAKLILIKDFDHFQSHGMFSGGTGDPLAGHLFNMHGDTWKNLRVKLSPSFSTAKLKGMYPLVEKIASEALTFADQLHPGGAMNVTEFYDKYSMEIIGSVGFGIECNGFRNPNSEFYLRGHDYFNPKSLYWTFTRALAFFAPDVFSMLKMKRISPKILNFFYSLVEETVEYRKNHSYKRNDYLQTLIELKNGLEVNNNTESGKETSSFSMQDVAANTLLYMFAGFETSATTGQFAAYELALNPHIQNLAREEVQKILVKYDGVCTYEAQNEMAYMNMVLDETMRKYPPMRALFRKCTKEYTLPDGLVIEEGTRVFIPIHGIQTDPDIFPEPHKFDPDRFSPENKAKMHPCHWMPFGEGPRKCLGLRQGYIQSKMALVKLISKYELILDKRTHVPIRYKAAAMSCAADSGVWIKLRPLAL